MRPGNSVALSAPGPAASISEAEPCHSEPDGSTRLTCPCVAFENCGVTQAAGAITSNTTTFAISATAIQGSAARSRRIQKLMRDPVAAPSFDRCRLQRCRQIDLAVLLQPRDVRL